MLVRLLYASRARGAVSQDILEAILTESRRNNPAQGITGILCYGGDVYMQLLEGGRAAVNDLYNRIVRDERHDPVTLLHYQEITERHCSGWTMGQVNLHKVNPSILLKYSERPQLDPFSTSGCAALALLEELMATAQIVGRTA